MSAAEEWRPVVGFGDYLVSSEGRVASTKRGILRVLTGGASVSGYRNVLLYQDGIRSMRRVHTLVAEAFHGPRPAGMEIRHLDGDMLNNSASNLRFGSKRENILDQVEHGTHVQASKTHCPAGHPYDERNTSFSRGARRCRPCHAARMRAYRTRQALRAANVTEVAA